MKYAFKNKLEAHFFWHAGPLNVYSYACVKSFIKAGFPVYLWSYDASLLVPGCTTLDARRVLPEKYLRHYSQGKYSKHEAAFTDFFRYALLSKNSNAIWCDTDVLCLRPASDFYHFDDWCVGRESPDQVGSAVLKVPCEFADGLLAKARTIAKRWDNKFPWGTVGPQLLTREINETNNIAKVSPISEFYPLKFQNALDGVNPKKSAKVYKLCANAYTYHIWNERLSRCRIPRDMLPPKGSFLYEEFIAAAPELSKTKTLKNFKFQRLYGSQLITRGISNAKKSLRNMSALGGY